MTKTMFRTLLAVTLLGTAFPALAQQGIPLHSAATVDPGSLALHAAESYHKAARYPNDSQVLSYDAVDPNVVEMTSTPITVGQDQDGPLLAVWTSQTSFVVGSPIEIFAKAAGDKAGGVVLSGEIVGPADEAVAKLGFFDDGATADKVAADGVFSASVRLADKISTPELAESYRVRVLATFADGSVREAVTGFILSNPWSTLTGRAKDRLEDGSLVISVEVDVERTGRFHLAGTLGQRRGGLIGTAQTAEVLEPGKHWVDLRFYGLMFHDRKARGPFVLESLQMRTTGAMPNAFNELAENVHIVRPLHLKSLAVGPYGNPELLDAAQRLTDEAAAARAERALPTTILD